jgi:hypothetical protein
MQQATEQPPYHKTSSPRLRELKQVIQGMKLTIGRPEIDHQEANY